MRPLCHICIPFVIDSWGILREVNEFSQFTQIVRYTVETQVVSFAFNGKCFDIDLSVGFRVTPGNVSRHTETVIAVVSSHLATENFRNPLWPKTTFSLLNSDPM